MRGRGEREGEKVGRDDALRAVIDVRTAWTGARHLRPFSLRLPTPTDCHHQRRAEYQPVFLMSALHFFHTSIPARPSAATVLPSTQTICYSFQNLDVSVSLAWWGWKWHQMARLIFVTQSRLQHVSLWKEWKTQADPKKNPRVEFSFRWRALPENFFRVSSLVLSTGCLSPKSAPLPIPPPLEEKT